VHLPPGGLAGPLTRAADQLGVRSTRLTIGSVTIGNGTARVRFTARDDLRSNHTWTYHGLLRLVNRDRRWWVSWSPGAIYPTLKSGQRFTLTTSWPARAPILSADGTVLNSPAAVAQSGSIAMLTGVVARATAKQAKRLGAPYEAGDLIGLGGIEEAFQNRLAGSPAMMIQIAGPGKHVHQTVHKFGAIEGKPVRTSIQMSVQMAASHAVSTASTKKPVDMVVIQPSTGKVLAVVERPGGWDRAIEGTFPPGSTFKVVTASGLAKTGLTPSSQVQCPSKVNIGGRTFHNDRNEHLGTTNLLNAFAISCNTTFAQLATQHLSGTSLAAMARTYGFNAKPALGIPAALGQFTRPSSPVDLAADAFGQGKDLVSPLSQATVVAAVASGTWRPPLLVTSPQPKQKARPHAISPAILATLRPMMHAVVTVGTAAGVGFPPDVYGKTGTAEYGTGRHLKSHGWFIGYRGDLAFAVLVEGGGFGASSAGPIANAFLHQA
jgi:cell division protein FtsI/penicillin-binding protein 2